MTVDEANNCLVRITRAAMGSYACRWRILSRDPLEWERADGLLKEAIRLRELAKRYAAVKVYR
jgi:hypothetical protein